MSATPELIYQIMGDHLVKMDRFVYEKGYRRGKCAYCSRECYNKSSFCTDTFLAIMNKGKICYMSECLYEFFKDCEAELLEWITE